MLDLLIVIALLAVFGSVVLVVLTWAFVAAAMAFVLPPWFVGYWLGLLPDPRPALREAQAKAKAKAKKVA
jgi:hypothetical protein